MRKQKIIGGKFGFPLEFPDQPTQPGFLSGNPILFFNARSAIKLLVDQLKPAKVWLPSYLCPTIISAIDQRFTPISFYPIDGNLSCASNDFLQDLAPGDLFLCIDYFGFPFDHNMLALVKRRGCLILRDCSQALYFDFQGDRLCDFYLFSPRKFLGVPDGGILQVRNNIKLRTDHLQPPDPESSMLLFQALLLRREFDLFGGSRTWFDYFNQGEARFEPGDKSMSELTKTLLCSAFEYEAIRCQRRSNYLSLLDKLGHLALFHVLPEKVTPLGFPIKVSSRDGLQKQLFSQDIYPPIHWDISSFVPKEFVESHELSQAILTLPCDQRYDTEDMSFVAKTLLENLT